MDKEIIGKQFDEERALYHLCHAKVTDCVFAGEADGESVLKETEDIHLSGCSFSLRYPLWRDPRLQTAWDQGGSGVPSYLRQRQRYRIAGIRVEIHRYFAEGYVGRFRVSVS